MRTRLSLAVLLALSSTVWAQKPAMLQLMAPPTLVNCSPVTQSPCMSARITPVSSDGKPAPFVLPAPNDLTNLVTLSSSDGEIHPFYASVGAGPDAAQHGNVSLLVLDISGSMNQPSPGAASRYAALKSSVADFINGMQEGVDRIAIVPFESHDVVPTIQSAVYVTTKADALAQLNAMPSPAAKNNTALYQAIFTGVESLRREISSLAHDGHTAEGLQPHLIVMTDGKNEVMPGDDPQLLSGELGLQQAVAQVQASHLDVIGIGFGDREAIDTAAMQKLSKRFFYAADAGELLTALHSSRSAVSHEMQITWLLPESSRVALMGHDHQWNATFRTMDGASLQSAPIRWIAPATNAPTFTRLALAPELQALIQVHPSAESGWTMFVLHTLLFAAAFVAMLMLWFWVPRLIWGEQYAGMVPQRSKRWSNGTAVTSASSVQIRSIETPPSGFETNGAISVPVQRSASQTTQIQPRDEFSRTRLTFDR
ncbi:MAG: VWA domain-containing protein [Acidobacteriaceae bacterium]|nr:VWA domain-containing protein [Acidobacteriaceae bacterium]